MCYVDVNAHKELFESLKSNVKVAFDGERFSYKVQFSNRRRLGSLFSLRNSSASIQLTSFPHLIGAFVFPQKLVSLNVAQLISSLPSSGGLRKFDEIGSLFGEMTVCSSMIGLAVEA